MDKPIITCAELRSWINRNRFGKYVQIDRLEAFVDHHEKTWKIASQLEGIRNNAEGRCAKCGLSTKGEEVAVTKRGVIHLRCLN